TDLHNCIKKGNILKEIHKTYIFYQLLRAVKFIHSANVIHRDLKPSNVLLDSDCHVKLCDFGLTRSLSSPSTGSGFAVESVADADFDGGDPELTEYVATRWYRAPEILLASNRYTKFVDMWSLGCILAEMLIGKPIFPGTSTINQIERIISVVPRPNRQDILALHSDYGMSVLEEALRKPSSTLDSLFPETVERNAVEMAKRLLQLNPSKRLTVEKALDHPYVQRFRDRQSELVMDHPVTPPLNDNQQLRVSDYRTKLYELQEKYCKHRQTIVAFFLALINAFGSDNQKVLWTVLSTFGSAKSCRSHPSLDGGLRTKGRTLIPVLIFCIKTASVDVDFAKKDASVRFGCKLYALLISTGHFGLGRLIHQIKADNCVLTAYVIMNRSLCYTKSAALPRKPRLEQIPQRNGVGNREIDYLPSKARAVQYPLRSYSREFDNPVILRSLSGLPMNPRNLEGHRVIESRQGCSRVYIKSTEGCTQVKHDDCNRNLFMRYGPLRTNKDLGASSTVEKSSPAGHVSYRITAVTVEKKVSLVDRIRCDVILEVRRNNLRLLRWGLRTHKFTIRSTDSLPVYETLKLKLARYPETLKSKKVSVVEAHSISDNSSRFSAKLHKTATWEQLGNSYNPAPLHNTSDERLYLKILEELKLFGLKSYKNSSYNCRHNLLNENVMISWMSKREVDSLSTLTVQSSNSFVVFQSARFRLNTPEASLLLQCSKYGNP
ncbi:mitogen-activated protein kinase, partial [Clonorchis sinensis]